MKKIVPAFPGILVFLSLMVPFFQVLTVSAQEVIWHARGRGLLYTKLEAESITAEETDTVHVYNIDTARYRLRFFHCQDLSEGRALSLAEWYEQTDVPLVFNVCSDVQKQVPTAYLRISGKTIQYRFVKAWKGLLVSDSSGQSRPSTRIVDLQFTPFSPTDPYFSDAYQQPMLLDENGEIRVNPRPYKAIRVAVGEDRDGNILIFLTEKPHRMWDIARWLQRCPFSLVRAMNLGGGNAIQVLGRSPVDRVYILGQDHSGSPIEELGALREEAAPREEVCCTMGVVTLPSQ